MTWVLAGLGFITLGVIVAVDRAGYWDAGEVISDWWPAAIIVFGLAQLAERPRSWLIPALIIAAGAILLLLTLDAFPDRTWDFIWPALLIGVGLWILYTYISRKRPVTSGEPEASILALFGDIRSANNSKAFSGGTVNALLGSAELDLRKATLAADGADVAAAAVFGETTIVVPDGWDVRVSGLPIFGDVEDKTRSDGTSVVNGPRLTVRALALFGEVEVKRR